MWALTPLHYLYVLTCCMQNRSNSAKLKERCISIHVSDQFDPSYLQPIKAKLTSREILLHYIQPLTLSLLAARRAPPLEIYAPCLGAAQLSGRRAHTV